MIKSLFTTINAALLIFLAYLCVQGIYARFEPGIPVSDSSVSTGSTVENKAGQTQADMRHERQKVGLIIKRNLFNVLPEEKITTKAVTRTMDPVLKNDKKPLALSLKGTVTADGGLFAVIEDTLKRKQALYLVGDQIQDATLKKIEKDQVLLEKDKEEIRLELDVAPKREGSGGSVEKKISSLPAPQPQTPVLEIPLDADFLNEAFSDTENMKKQVRYRTYHRNGKIDGILLYGIRPDSVFTAMGLRNGDIVQQVDGRTVSDIDEALEALKRLQEDESCKFTLLRSGRPQQFVFKLNRPEEE